MARIFITGSSDGLGLIAARTLIADGHKVVLHARNDQRAAQTKEKAPGAEAILVSDISTVAGMKHLATQANKSGKFDTVIHNAGTGYTNSYQKTEDGVDATFAINSLAPYVLTCLMDRPQRLLYTSSGLHSGGDGSLEDVGWSEKRWNGFQAYSDSKLHDVILSFAVARHWKDVQSNAIDPGWVATKMGGASAPGTADEGADTLSWLGGGNASDTGKLYKSRKPIRSHGAAGNVETQEKFLRICEEISRVPFPR